MQEFKPLSELRASTQPLALSVPKNRVLQTELFLKGPVPMRWIQLASVAGRSALTVGILLWFRRGLLKKDEVDLNLSSFGSYGLNRHTAGRALKRLEKQGLAAVKRFKGRKSLVLILQIQPNETTSLKQPQRNVTLETE